jgi:hypothetical protein
MRGFHALAGRPDSGCLGPGRSVRPAWSRGEARMRRAKRCDSKPRTHVNWAVQEPVALQVAYRLQCMRTTERMVL